MNRNSAFYEVSYAKSTATEKNVFLCYFSLMCDPHYEE